ncbi:MAG: hypothetical protein ABRQ25_05790 [Clostridiaceae bacterium]
MDIDSLVSECIHSAINYGISAYEVITDSKRTNKLYKINFNNFKRLKSQGDKGIEKLSYLLKYNNDYVRYSAAVHLLTIKENEAKTVLYELSICSGIFGFSAEMLLKEWNNGNLREYLVE